MASFCNHYPFTFSAWDLVDCRINSQGFFSDCVSSNKSVQYTAEDSSAVISQRTVWLNRAFFCLCFVWYWEKELVCLCIILLLCLRERLGLGRINYFHLDCVFLPFSWHHILNSCVVWSKDTWHTDLVSSATVSKTVYNTENIKNYGDTI